MSYSHSDSIAANSLLVGLKRKLCRIWYDDGLTPGESWNDELAQKIKESRILIVLLTENSSFSKYVKAEINFAISNDKTIIVLQQQGTVLPAGIELMLSPYQFIHFSSIEDLEKTIEDLTKVLPKDVFSYNEIPFLENANRKFFIHEHSIENPNNKDKTADGFSIICDDQNGRSTLFDFTGTFAYDIKYSITQCIPIADDFYVGNINGVYLVNVLADCCLNYPLYGPDFECLMMFVLRSPDDDEPSVRMIDFRYIHVNGVTIEGKTVENSSWSLFLHQRIKEKLC